MHLNNRYHQPSPRKTLKNFQEEFPKEESLLDKNLITALEYTNGILANHQAMLESICKITGITIQDIKKELKNGI